MGAQESSYFQSRCTPVLVSTDGCCCPHENSSAQVVGPAPISQRSPLNFADFVSGQNSQNQLRQQQHEERNLHRRSYPNPSGHSPQLATIDGSASSQQAQQSGADYGRQGPRENSIADSLKSAESANKTASDWAADQAQFAHLPPLPAGWMRVVSRSTGEVYYYCPETNETTFDKPTQAAELLSNKKNTLPEGWSQRVSRGNGRVYYWHAETNKSQFEIPTEADAGVGGPSSSSPETFMEVTPRFDNDPKQSKGDLPEGWEQIQSKTTGQPYYFNFNTKQSQFEHPCALQS